MQAPRKILMCRPDYFEVTYAGNEFMKENIGKVDKLKAFAQWEQLKSIYVELGYEINLIEPVEGLVDMVFTANQSFPFLDGKGNKKVILSKMKNQERLNEVKYFRTFYEKEGYEVLEPHAEVSYFEGMGDTLINYNRNLIISGYGYRSDNLVYHYLSNNIKYKVIKIELINNFLYHLDTCFSILNSDSVVIDKSAFSKADLDKIKQIFPKIIAADNSENLKYFVCNCHCPDGKNVIVQKGSRKFKEDIKKAGFNIIETDTSEFIKSGGSVFCMKMMYF